MSTDIYAEDFDLDALIDEIVEAYEEKKRAFEKLSRYEQIDAALNEHPDRWDYLMELFDIALYETGRDADDAYNELEEMLYFYHIPYSDDKHLTFEDLVYWNNL